MLMSFCRAASRHAARVQPMRASEGRHAWKRYAPCWREPSPRPADPLIPPDIISSRGVAMPLPYADILPCWLFEYFSPRLMMLSPGALPRVISARRYVIWMRRK